MFCVCEAVVDEGSWTLHTTAFWKQTWDFLSIDSLKVLQIKSLALYPWCGYATEIEANQYLFYFYLPDVSFFFKWGCNNSYNECNHFKQEIDLIVTHWFCVACCVSFFKDWPHFFSVWKTAVFIYSGHILSAFPLSCSCMQTPTQPQPHTSCFEGVESVRLQCSWTLVCPSSVWWSVSF